MADKVVQVPGVGTVSFPDTMSDDDISSVIAQQHPELQKAQPSADTGAMAALKRVGSGLLHAPGAIYDAFTKPPQNDEEKVAMNVPIPAPGGSSLPPQITLGLHRLITLPAMREAEKAQQYQAQAGPQQPLGIDFSGTGNTPQEKAQHLANLHQIASMVPLVGPMASDITQRYLGMGQYEGQPDKSGAVTETFANIAAPKAMEGGVNLGLQGLSKVAPAVAERMYQSALKPSTTIPAAQRAAITQTGLSAGIPISESGAAKLSGLIDDLNQKIKDQIQAGAQAGQTIDPQAVAARADQIKGRFANQVNPSSDLQAIEASRQEFLQNNPNPIPVDQAQAMKQGTYAQLKGRAYGELKSATIESQKALARGLKEELENQFPEIKGLNAQESQFYNLDGVLERALNRINNHQLVGIGTPIVAGAAGGMAGAGPGMVAGLMKAVLDDPIVKSRLAITLGKAGKLPPNLATGRINQFVNALGQSQQKEQSQ